MASEFAITYQACGSNTMSQPVAVLPVRQHVVVIAACGRHSRPWGTLMAMSLKSSSSATCGHS
eukprot:6185841-Heterocapsa_arctica.AAC.1